MKWTPEQRDKIPTLFGGTCGIQVYIYASLHIDVDDERMCDTRPKKSSVINDDDKIPSATRRRPCAPTATATAYSQQATPWTRRVPRAPAQSQS